MEIQINPKVFMLNWQFKFLQKKFLFVPKIFDQGIKWAILYFDNKLYYY